MSNMDGDEVQDDRGSREEWTLLFWTSLAGTQRSKRKIHTRWTCLVPKAQPKLCDFSPFPDADCIPSMTDRGHCDLGEFRSLVIPHHYLYNVNKLRRRHPEDYSKLGSFFWCWPTRAAGTTWGRTC